LTIVDLTEEQQASLEDNPASKEVIRLIHQKHREKFSLSQDIFTHEYKIQSNGYVGFIQLGEQISIHVKPKVKVGNIFRMLEYAYKLKSFELLEGNTLVESIEDIFERLAVILARNILDRNRKGLYRGYIPRNEDLPFIRGKLQPKQTIISIMRGSSHACCIYEENTADIEDNELLLWSLYKLHQFDIKRAETKRKVRMAYRELVNKVALVNFEPQDYINRFYNRLNMDYRPMHGVCRFLLEQSGPGLEIGKNEFFPFTLYMPSLFESFVAEWLREKLPRTFHLDAQYTTVLDPEKNVFFRIDLVVSKTGTEEIICVLDTKYKKSDESRASDVAQVVAYSTKMKTNNAFLIYPSKDTREFCYSVGNVTVKSLIFDLGGDIEESGRVFLEKLLKSLSIDSRMLN
jgi:5-methylcytosine-specific restriction enzyme subunit McrC